MIGRWSYVRKVFDRRHVSYWRNSHASYSDLWIWNLTDFMLRGAKYIQKHSCLFLTLLFGYGQILRSYFEKLGKSEINHSIYRHHCTSANPPVWFLFLNCLLSYLLCQAMLIGIHEPLGTIEELANNINRTGIKTLIYCISSIIKGLLEDLAVSTFAPAPIL